HGGLIIAATLQQPAERHAVEFHKVLYGTAIDLGKRGIAGTAIGAQIHEPVPRLGLSIEEPLERYLPGMRHDAARSEHEAQSKGSRDSRQRNHGADPAEQRLFVRRAVRGARKESVTLPPPRLRQEGRTPRSLRLSARCWLV